MLSVETLNIAAYFFFAISFLAIPIMLVSLFRYRKLSKEQKDSGAFKSFLIGIGSFVIPLMLSMILSMRVQSMGLQEVSDYFNSLDKPYTIKVNGTPVTNEEEVVMALKSTGPKMAHHSHPTKMIKV